MAFYLQQERDENFATQDIQLQPSFQEWLADSDSSEGVLKVLSPSSVSEQKNRDMVSGDEEHSSVSSWSDEPQGVLQISSERDDGSEDDHIQLDVMKDDVSSDSDHNRKSSQIAISEMNHRSDSSDSRVQEQFPNPNPMYCLDMENVSEIPNINPLRTDCFREPLSSAASLSADEENNQDRIHNQANEFSEDSSNMVQAMSPQSTSEDDLEKGCCPAPSLKQLDEHEEVAGECCRVCYLAVDRSSMSGEVIKLGCACKDDLAVAHRHCAEAWFKIKGDRICEICGSIASNIIGNGEVHFVEQWNDFETNSGMSHVAERCWQNQPLCNSLLACLILVLILSWLFRVTLS